MSTVPLSKLPRLKQTLTRRRKMILVIEDEALVREVTCEVLGGCGYQVLTASTVSEARRIAREIPLNLAICDAVLPDGSGIDLCDELSTNYKGVRVILTSGYPPSTLRRDCNSRVERVLTKPYSADLLVQTVSRVLHAPMAQSRPAYLRA